MLFLKGIFKASAASEVGHKASKFRRIREQRSAFRRKIFFATQNTSLLFSVTFWCAWKCLRSLGLSLLEWSVGRVAMPCVPEWLGSERLTQRRRLQRISVLCVWMKSVGYPLSRTYLCCLRDPCNHLLVSVQGIVKQLKVLEDCIVQLQYL